MFLKKTVILSLLVFATVAENTIEKSDQSEPKKTISRDCGKSYSVTCLKLDIVSWVDKLNEDDNYRILPGVSVIRENSRARASTADIVAELARDFPNNAEARLDAFLLKKVTDYVNSHTVKVDLYKRNEVETARQGGGLGGGGGGGGKGGGGGGGGGGMRMVLAAAAMMKGTLMALAMGGIAAMAGKALMTGMIALMLSTIIGLKSLTSQGGKQTTYEIVSKPVYTHANTHSVSHEDHGGYGHSSYGRSFEIPIPVGLSQDYKPPQ